VKRKRKLASWVLDIINDCGQGITRDKFIEKLVKRGRESKNEKEKERMRKVYKIMKMDGAYWERK